MKYLISLLALSASASAVTTVQLASVMNPNSFMAEYDITGVQAQIGFGDGTAGDADGLYDVNNLTQQFGSANVFPRESAFTVGSLTYDEAGVTGIGTESVAITSIDLGEFWSPDPSRTSGAAATVVSDISDNALGVWFFEAPGSIEFGALDGADMLTFTNGVLTSIDLSLSSSFVVDYTGTGGPGTSYDGTFSISGNAISYQIDETEVNVPTAFGTVPQSSFVADLSGSVIAVPEPSSVLLSLVGGMFLFRRRR